MHTAHINSVQVHTTSSHQTALTKCKCKGKIIRNYKGNSRASNQVWCLSKHAALWGCIGCTFIEPHGGASVEPHGGQQTLPNVPCGARLPLVENHRHEVHSRLWVGARWKWWKKNTFIMDLKCVILDWEEQEKSEQMGRIWVRSFSIKVLEFPELINL